MQPAKTLWDWLQLLIVPVILIAAVTLWNSSQTARENHRADKDRQDTMVGAYFDRLSNLMLHEHLLDSRAGESVKARESVRALARTVTLGALHRLDGERKADVVRFLYEAGLLARLRPSVRLNDADLRHADLDRANLGDANLEGTQDLGSAGANLGGASFVEANLRNANLANADLGDAVLRAANLDGANLSGARLAGATFESAELRRTNLADAKGYNFLKGVNLKNASLQGAVLDGADLEGADLTYADLTGASLRDADLRGANLEGATLLDAKNLDLGHYITGLPLKLQKNFLDSQKAFLDSLSRDDLASFRLSPEKLAELRRHANAA